MADIDTSGATDTSLDIFETLSNNIDKDEKDNKEEKEDEIPLREPKDKKEDKEEEEDEEEVDEETDDEDDDEDEEAEETDEETEATDEDDEDELELSKIPTLKQIKAKYPNITKEFKALEHIFYREKAYAEVFPTVKDAKSAQGEIVEYNKIQDELLSGDITGTLDRVKRANPKAYDKIANNIIESLIKVDKDSYIEPARMIMKTAISNVYNLASAALKKDASNKKAEQIQIAAELIHEALFQTNEVSGYAKQAAEEEKENPELKRLQEKESQLNSRQFQEAHGKITDRFNNLVTRTLEKNIDTKNVLSGYVKSNLIKDVKAELDRQLISDKRFGGIVKKLYERAKESNYSEESLNNVITALRNKAGSILPEIMRAKKGEALKGSSSVKAKPKARELSREDESEDATTRNSSRERLTRGDRKKESEEPRPGESILDYLDRKLG